MPIDLSVLMVTLICAFGVGVVVGAIVITIVLVVILGMHY